MGSLRPGTIDKCRHCGQRIVYRRFDEGELIERNYQRGPVWAHREPYLGKYKDWRDDPEVEGMLYFRCNPKNLPEAKREHASSWGGYTATPDSYCTEQQQSDNSTCFRRITDREFMKCGLHARPQRQRQIEQEEARKQRAINEERNKIYEYEVSLIEKEVGKLPETLGAELYSHFSFRPGKDDKPIMVLVDLFALQKELGIED